MIFYGNFREILKKKFSELQFKTKTKYKCITYNFLFQTKDMTINLVADPASKKVSFSHGLPKKGDTSGPKILTVENPDISGNPFNKELPMTLTTRTFNNTGHVTTESEAPCYIHINSEKEKMELIQKDFNTLETLIPQNYLEAGKNLEEIVNAVVEEGHMQKYIENSYAIPQPHPLGVADDILSIGFILNKEDEKFYNDYVEHWEGKK